MKRVTSGAMVAMMLWAGVVIARAEAGGMGGSPVASQGHGRGGGAVVVGPGSTVIINQGPTVLPAPPAYRFYPSYPAVRPYPYAGVYPYQYSQPYSSHPFAGRYPAVQYPAAAYPVYPVYVDPGYSSVIVGQPPAYWVAGYWAQQWVPVYSTYQVWCPPYYDQRGLWIEGRWEDRSVENGGYYDGVWVEGYWTR